MKKLFLLLFALIPALSFADNVSQDKAQAIAQDFFASKALMSTSSSSPVSLRMIWDGESKVTRSAEAPAFYVFNNENGKGFVIVSGDECTTTPILAYSFDQNFSAENMPANVSNWMNGIRRDINEARKNGTASENRWDLTEHNDRTPIKLMETALWDQRAPYNSELPNGYVTGCPATAIAIVMRYHKWPDKGVGTIPESNDKIGAVKLGHTYDWENMPLDYTGATEAQNKQVGILMRDVGAMVLTQYGGGTAGAKPEETLPQFMPIYMRYNAKTIKSVLKKNFTDAEWHKMLKKELDENRPVLYGGYSSGGGHQFVLDGYAADNYYHVNWGWSGVSNGYYLLTDMNPPEQGAGGSSSADGFTKKQDAIIGIQPDPTNPGGGEFDRMVYKQVSENKPYGMSTDAKSFKQNEKFSVSLKDYQNKGTRAFRGNIAIAHYSAGDELKGIICSKITSYKQYPQQINDNTENTYTCTITEPIENGDYIAGVFKYQNPSEWTMIHNGYPDTEDLCIEKIIIKEGGAIPSDPDLSSTQLSYLAETGMITLTLPADNVTVSVYKTGTLDSFNVVSKEGRKVTINTQSLTPGSYTVKLQRGNESKTFEITV